MSENRFGNRASAFVIGLGIGAALGVLFAPKAGEELREDISGTVRDCVDDAVRQSRRIRRDARDAYQDVKGRFRDAVDAGGRAYRHAVAGRS